MGVCGLEKASSGPGAMRWPHPVARDLERAGVGTGSVSHEAEPQGHGDLFMIGQEEAWVFEQL